MQPYPPPSVPPPFPPPFPPPGGGSSGVPRGGGSYLVPIVALATTFVLLVAAIMVVLVVRYGDRADDDRLNTAGGDPCVVGSWQVDDYQEDVALPEPFGRTRFTGTGPGARVELRADGHGRTDYGDGTTFAGVVSGIALTLTVTGEVSYRYRAVDGTVAFTDVVADGTVTLSGAGLAPQRDALTAEFEPASYECDGDTLVQQTSLYTARMSRR
ncbi:hypothetical protein O7623_20010 [Solwaraspora sp. WMMD791]|uniref:hypothetical protein n=1 Tax=Solwaraspora sp. WMMD791 TaxID=3016086 RepID=UPI002499BB4F|nr:hypothetical protein [Solwaraspora sp. WMMD791]WFE25654.1 hypothetical protein O7623_20010 [Solwaraspora sp. WMMD791]